MTAGQTRLRRAALFTSLIAAGGALCAVLPACRTVPQAELLRRSRAFYASQPQYQRPVPLQRVPAGLTDIKASTCGTCHAEIYAEWKVSTHARAWEDDAQFMAELHKSGQDGKDVRWMCINCHTPLENQLDQLVAGLKGGRVAEPILVDNPAFDAELQDEAITCATCHVRDGYILGPYGDTMAPHPVRKDPELLDERVCMRCHQAMVDYPEIPLTCAFNTGEEFRGSPYKAEGKACQTCHMPEVKRQLMAGYPDRTTRRHWFGGSLIPKHRRFAAELEPLKQHYPDGMTLTWVDLPPTLPAGEPVRLEVEIENAEAGHLLPTGDVERFITIEASASGPGGVELATLQERIGTKYTWWPTIEKLADNRLSPKEKRRYTLQFVAPAAGSVELRLKADKWRISEENLAYHELEDSYVAGRTFHDGTLTLQVESSPR